MFEPLDPCAKVLKNEVLLRALFSQHALNMNLFFLTYDNAYDSSLFFSKLEDLDPNLLPLLSLVDGHDYIVSLKKEHFFFFDSFGFEAAEALASISEDKIEASEGLEEADHQFLEESSALEEEEYEEFNFLFKKSAALAAFEEALGSESSDEEATDGEATDGEEMQAIDCKKFFKLKKREVLFFLRKFYFGYKVSRSHVATFLKKLKKKSTLEVCNCTSNRFIDATSLFFYFFNASYIKFLLRHGYLYLDFGRLPDRIPDLGFGSFVSCLFFSDLFAAFSFFKDKVSHYAKVLSRKMNRDLSLSVRNLLTLKRKNMNFLKFLNTADLVDTRAIEMDYLSLSFFFFGTSEVSLGANQGINVFLHRLLTFR